MMINTCSRHGTNTLGYTLTREKQCCVLTLYFPCMAFFCVDLLGTHEVYVLPSVPMSSEIKCLALYVSLSLDPLHASYY